MNTGDSYSNTLSWFNPHNEDISVVRVIYESVTWKKPVLPEWKVDLSKHLSEIRFHISELQSSLDETEKLFNDWKEWESNFLELFNAYKMCLEVQSWLMAKYDFYEPLIVSYTPKQIIALKLKYFQFNLQQLLSSNKEDKTDDSNNDRKLDFKVSELEWFILNPVIENSLRIEYLRLFKETFSLMVYKAEFNKLLSEQNNK